MPRKKNLDAEMTAIEDQIKKLLQAKSDLKAKRQAEAEAARKRHIAKLTAVLNRIDVERIAPKAFEEAMHSLLGGQARASAPATAEAEQPVTAGIA